MRLRYLEMYVRNYIELQNLLKTHTPTDIAEGELSTKRGKVEWVNMQSS